MHLQTERHTQWVTGADLYKTPPPPPPPPPSPMPPVICAIAPPTRTRAMMMAAPPPGMTMLFSDGTRHTVLAILCPTAPDVRLRLANAPVLYEAW